MKSESMSNRTWITGLLICTILGCALRLPGMTDDFSIDEIFSLQLVSQTNSPGEIFTRLKIDNTHWLTSLYMRAIGWQKDWWRYRLMSLAWGVATIPLAGLIVRRRFGREAALIASALCALCYFLVHYSSEARGYAPSACFALAGVVALDRLLDRDRPPATALNAVLVISFWIACILGFFSHQIFLFAFAGMSVWLFAELWRDRSHLRAAIFWAILMSVPIVCAGLLYWFSIRGQAVIGWDAQSISSGVGELIEYTFGTPRELAVIIPVGAIVAGLFIWQCIAMARRDERFWILLAVTCIAAPGIVLTFRRPTFFFARFLFIIVPFLLIAIALAIHDLRKRWRWLGTICLAAFAIGNVWQIARFYRDGRGHSLDALRFIAEQTPGPVARITADGGNPASQTVAFYNLYLPDDKRIEFVDREHWKQSPPQWLVEISTDRIPFDPPPMLQLPDTGEVFYHVRDYPYFGLVGMNWHLYADHPIE